MLRRILKKLFPVVFLKKAFVLYNSIRIKTVDRILFPEYKISSGSLLHKAKPKPFGKVSLEDLNDPILLKYMDQWLNWEQEDFIVKITKPSIIEPKHGWSIVGRKLNYYSLGFSRTIFMPKPSFATLLFPNPVVEIKKVVSLRDTGEENYFHFYNDVVGKIVYLKEHGVDLNEYTFLISKKLWERKYFQYFHKRIKLLSDLNYHVQESEFIKAEESIYCKPMTHSKSLFDLFMNAAEIRDSSVERKIFLKRGKGRLRFIENDTEIEELVEGLGFEIIDTDLLSVEEQISLFSEVRWLVAIHGAGLTNIIYRKGKPLSLLEIFPPPTEGYLAYHYLMLSKMYNYNYYGIVAEKQMKKYSGGFYLNPSILKAKVEVLLRS